MPTYADVWWCMVAYGVCRWVQEVLGDIRLFHMAWERIKEEKGMLSVCVPRAMLYA
jgi:hypothetical protein